jgi:hypothetical protein
MVSEKVATAGNAIPCFPNESENSVFVISEKCLRPKRKYMVQCLTLKHQAKLAKAVGFKPLPAIVLRPLLAKPMYRFHVDGAPAVCILKRVDSAQLCSKSVRNRPY